MSISKNIASNSVTFLSELVPVFKSCPPCPICMPKYAVLFALFGLELADYSQYLMPIMMISMFISLGSIYNKSINRKISLMPFYLGVTSSSLLLFSKFYIDNIFISFSCMFGLGLAIILHYSSLRRKSCHC